ncbi:MAG: ribonuclease III [Candidatus Levybacteria bacterium CG10_big_fil_rev_8_21_14_0_10_35_13]|nr:MAG: ribonuclease III [Candidatus Levybacteria bacterium CG10_big_fil_rev_8_21_14_0_10_35_13]
MTKLPNLNNKKLFDQAFTHRSYLNEVKEKISSNERLEFLGDSIISFVISSYLFSKFPQFNEGILTNIRSLLVNTKSLAEIARNLDIGKHLKLSKGEEDSNGRENQSLLADSFEAFVGSLFLDSGIEKTEEFIIEIFGPMAEKIARGKSFKDPKSLLQEYVQGKKQNSPLYKVLKEIGPAHAKIFVVGVYVGNSMPGKGEGKSKQDAEENAAQEALDTLRKR